MVFLFNVLSVTSPLLRMKTVLSSRVVRKIGLRLDDPICKMVSATILAVLARWVLITNLPRLTGELKWFVFLTRWCFLITVILRRVVTLCRALVKRQVLKMKHRMRTSIKRVKFLSLVFRLVKAYRLSCLVCAVWVKRLILRLLLKLSRIVPLVSIRIALRRHRVV